ncbi:putative lipid II flippase FtsW [Nesterenkonia sp. E16_7]|uniref:putative lipid II flippase FtsW n=1 Tax=unclassified Nesterenkonia TaxID=2629769 RepID=UPI001A933524|nr:MULTISPECIES: putative lipid II flippase FtsW [unclassified Nesterenkonia]MBO0595106.1 putative lipid II flippase FtsW [Nesterenkonia sp. E16_10]MBO0598761.1 putative lipid II flippase FtsW [Nesterenkonia sp. E16_7]
MDKRRPRVPASPEQRRSQLRAVEDSTAPAQPRPAQRASQERPAQEAEDSDGAAGRRWKAERTSSRQNRVQRFWSFLEIGNPYTTFWLVLGSTLALAVIGLTFVLSSTSVDPTGGAFTTVSRQATWAVIGLLGMFVMMILPTSWLRAIGWFLMLASMVMLALVAFTPLGHTSGGSTNWLRIGPVQGQPSEVAKLGLVMWGAAVLARKGPLLSQFAHWVTPFVAPGALAVLVLVLAGGDLGTSLIILLIVGTLLFAAGVAMRYFVIAASLAAVMVALLMLLTPYRMMRVWAWLGVNCDHPTDPCHQMQQGYYALASGGFWGVGLGQSRQKWDYIPEVHNDFIFTIIGEELGLLGTFTVLGLFAVLAVGMFRVAYNTEDQFTRLVCLGVVAWINGQAFINIGMVTGVLPVVGVPLPFISSGGSAMTVTLIAVGVVLNFARRQRQQGPPRRGRTAPSKAAATAHRTPISA